MRKNKQKLGLFYLFIIINILVTLFLFNNAQTRYVLRKTILLDEINILFLDSYYQLRNMAVAYHNAPRVSLDEAKTKSQQYHNMTFFTSTKYDHLVYNVPDIFNDINAIKHNLESVTQGYLATLSLVKYNREYALIVPQQYNNYSPLHRSVLQSIFQKHTLKQDVFSEEYNQSSFRGCFVYLSEQHKENDSGLSLFSILMPLYNKGKLDAVVIADIKSTLFPDIIRRFNRDNNTTFYLSAATAREHYTIPCSPYQFSIGYSDLSLLRVSDLLIALIISTVSVFVTSHLLAFRTRIYLDSLTGLHNRHYVHDNLRKLPPCYSVLVIDADDFKQVNDVYGHDVGDQVLKSISLVLQTLTRETDIVARWGGEEFVLIMMTDREDIIRHRAEHICHTIAQMSPATDIKQITVSIGGCIARYQTFDTVFKIADECLYASKHKGKNQVTLTQIL
ncbi:MAG: GGDEF domain-containing protein [Plesiomonas sp.]|uniref:GGDEF domain-containing protein n=1 Tax=Plesiomonas sp. TaxID=2486279 RepID=UPI003F2C59A3